jgi:hypothetical protein
MKAKLPMQAKTDDGTELATQDLHICPACGGCHTGEVERCHACSGSMAGQLPVKRTLRIDNVQAQAAERITANDEERVRQGFEIQTVFSWPRRDGRTDVTEAEFKCGEVTLFSLQYANRAEISRINKGLKRRKEQTVLGFMIDPQTGYWAKSEDEDSSTDMPPDVVKPVRIVPIVRDHKNALLIRLSNPGQMAPETVPTLQHALLRGIALSFQLEEAEVLGEPLPSRDDRRAILAYEATEGGAGVLGQLIETPDALPRVARKALSLMHYSNVEEAIAAADASILESEAGSCVRGCYRCLLSYYNQPDHEKIDRTGLEVCQMLIDIARGERFLRAARPGSGVLFHALAARGLPAPEGAPVSLGGQQYPFVWRDHRVAASTEPPTKAALEAAADQGWTLVELPPDDPAGLPDALVSALSS